MLLRVGQMFTGTQRGGGTSVDKDSVAAFAASSET